MIFLIKIIFRKYAIVRMLREREIERNYGYSTCPSKWFNASYGWIDKMNEGSKEINKKVMISLMSKIL